MPFWSDIYNSWSLANKLDPIRRREISKEIEGAGVTVPNVIGDMRAGADYLSGAKGTIQLRDSTDYVDVSSVSNRQARYKEYERLRTVPEIESALTIFADEACVVGDTKVATPFGYMNIKDLAERKSTGEKFMVYCYDFAKQDYTLGWAHHPRLVKKEKTVVCTIGQGLQFRCTADHLVLLRDGTWIEAGNLKTGSEIMPFYRRRPTKTFKVSKNKQFPRIFTHTRGWIHERDFIEEWRTGEPQREKLYKIVRAIVGGLKTKQVEQHIGKDWDTCSEKLRYEGFCYDECKELRTLPDRMKILSVWPGLVENVYDLSVDQHENFCTETGVFHNCQFGENGHTFEVSTKNADIKQELEFLFFHPSMLNIDENLWGWVRDLFLYGDHFVELVIDKDEPKLGVLKAQSLPPESMFRIDTVKGKTVEFQQGKDGPDYQALTKSDVTKATQAELNSATTIRFEPNSIVHFSIGGNRKTFYPYGVSIVEAARGPAHQLKLLEDAMVVYRLCLAGDTRVRTVCGWKFIKELDLFDMVYCMPEYGNTKYTGIVAKQNNGVKPVFRVRSRHHEIIGTDNHPILVKRDGKIQYVDIKDLKIKSDQLFSPTQDASVDKPIQKLFEAWAKLSDEQRRIFRVKNYPNRSAMMRKVVGDAGRVRQFLYKKQKALPLVQAEQICDLFGLDKKQLIIVNKNERNEDTLNLPANVTEDFARLLGFLFGDGWATKTLVGFAAGDDFSITEKYQSLLESFLGTAKFEHDPRSPHEHCGTVNCNSSVAARIFRELGLNADHDKIRVPSWMYLAPKSIRKAFVEGLSDADGCQRRTNKGTWFSTIELSNLGLVQDVKELWTSIGMCSGHLKTRNRKGGHEIEPGRIIPDTISHSVTISELLLPEFENVCIVKPFGEQEVYDITVEHGCHNFIANGIPVHNSRAPERRVFYIDVGQMSSFRAEAFMEQMKDKLRKKKLFSAHGGAFGAGPVEERNTQPSLDEDIWVPIRPNTNTRIETLPGASNLSEQDDVLYFRTKLFVAMCFPRNYLAQDDPSITKVTLSSVDIKFARLVERFQRNVASGLLKIATRHLNLRGFPSELFDDLQIKMTPPSHYRELSENEIKDARVQRLASLKGTMVYSDLDLLVDVMHEPLDKAKELVARSMVQKLQELKLQVMSQNPGIMGLTMPPPPGNELGTQPGGPTPDDMSGDTGGDVDAGGQQQPGTEAEDTYGQSDKPESAVLPEPTDDDLKKYDLELMSYGRGMDDEEIDAHEVEGE